MLKTVHDTSKLYSTQRCKNSRKEEKKLEEFFKKDLPEIWGKTEIDVKLLIIST